MLSSRLLRGNERIPLYRAQHSTEPHIADRFVTSSYPHALAAIDSRRTDVLGRYSSGRLVTRDCHSIEQYKYPGLSSSS